jgi:hypothetical protein
MTGAIGLIKSKHTWPIPISWFEGFEKEGVTAAPHKKDENLDLSVIDSCGYEWATFDYGETETTDALNTQLKAYSAPIDSSQYNQKISVAADFGAGSGPWASRLIPFFVLRSIAKQRCWQIS